MQGLSSDFPINPLLPSGGTWMTMYQRKVKNCRLLKAMMKSSPQLKIMMIDLNLDFSDSLEFHPEQVVWGEGASGSHPAPFSSHSWLHPALQGVSPECIWLPCPHILTSCSAPCKHLSLRDVHRNSTVYS